MCAAHGFQGRSRDLPAAPTLGTCGVKSLPENYILELRQNMRGPKIQLRFLDVFTPVNFRFASAHFIDQPKDLTQN